MNIPNPHFPVNILLNNSSQLFESLCDKYQLQYNFKKGLSKRLKIIYTDSYLNDFAEVKEHYDEDDNKYYQISVWDNYCQFLWIICYSSMVFMDELIIKPILEPKVKQNEELLETTFDMFKAGMSLFNRDFTQRANRSVFFEFPNPVNNKGDETIESANRLFEGALCFNLFHEYSHIDLGHLEKEYLKDDELAADYSGFYSMYENLSLEKKKYLSLSIIIALGTLLFRDNTLSGETHPDPDDRLGQLLDKMEDLDNQGKEYCYCLAVTLYKMWAYHYGLEFIIPKIDKADFYKEYFSLIQEAFSNYKILGVPDSNK